MKNKPFISTLKEWQSTAKLGSLSTFTWRDAERVSPHKSQI